MGQQARLHPLCHWLGHRSWQRLAIPLPLLQKWRRRVPYSLLPHPVPRWYSHVLYGAGHGADAYHRRFGCLQDCSDLQRYRLRGCRDVMLDERLLHRDPRLGHLLLLHVHAIRRTMAHLRQLLEHRDLREPLRP